LASGVQQAVITSPVKALGQHVLEQQPKKIDAGHGANFGATGLAGFCSVTSAVINIPAWPMSGTAPGWK
jgi:hypothetical protein